MLENHLLGNSKVCHMQEVEGRQGSQLGDFASPGVHLAMPGDIFNYNDW